MIRFLDSAGIPTAIYAIEVDARLYAPEEIEAIVRAAERGDVCDPRSETGTLALTRLRTPYTKRSKEI